MPTNIVFEPEENTKPMCSAASSLATGCVSAAARHTPRFALRPLDPQMRVDIARANAPFLASLAKQATVEPPCPRPAVPAVKALAPQTSSADANSEHSRLELQHPFSLAGLPKLEQHIIPEHLPEELFVFDRGDITGRHPRRPETALRYVRAYPRVPGSKTRASESGVPLRRGYLFLDPENRVADGRRSAVHRAPLVATLGPKSATGSAPPKRVAVVAKTAKGSCRSHHLLRQEGKVYSSLPLRAGPPESEPLVPRFYGLYIPVDSEGRRLGGKHPHCDGYIHADCAVEWPTPILLMEDCGAPVPLEEMKNAERRQCWSLIDSLHQAGIAHGSAHPRNILVQPGPLCAPAEDRSMRTPSYRLISLGRAETLWPRAGAGPPTRLAWHTFQKVREQDVQVALSALRLWEPDEAEEVQQ
ncbi:hypothetical protein BV20DRAFT_640466 [Pilatotrama ljubarskyi]|nr:hypothetical protein BV20DRAFT_640466 [Pilatotrama ljubarskyi]